jgi:hypothetical protein
MHWLRGLCRKGMALVTKVNARSEQKMPDSVRAGCQDFQFSGATVASQVAIVVMLVRTTASWKVQK